MRQKDIKWLREAAQPGSGMYPGIRADFLPVGPRHRLEDAGLIERYAPHNPVHTDRYVATEEGLEVLYALPPEDR